MEAQQETVTLESIANESKADQAARNRFAKFDNLLLIAIIEKKGNEGTAEVSIYERDGRLVTVAVPDSDYLERGAQELAARYSNARLDILHI